MYSNFKNINGDELWDFLDDFYKVLNKHKISIIKFGQLESYEIVNGEMKYDVKNMYVEKRIY
jgi:hypothetical protein